MIRSTRDHRQQVGAVPACLLALVISAIGVRADGVAVIKRQPFHRDSSAKAVAYQQINSLGPFLRLETYRGNIDIGRSKLADRIEFPDPPPPDLMEESDLAPIRDSLVAMKRFSVRYPASAPLLQPEMEVVSGYVERFEAGDVRFEGRWIAKREIPALLETRRRNAEARRLQEAEQVAADEARKDMGLVRMNGAWVSKQAAMERPPAARTQLSDTLWPLINPDLDGARLALEMLSDLAVGQTGAAKVRTERLGTVIRNLFLAEFRLTRQMIATTAADRQATVHERETDQYLKPNAFGTEREEAARESLSRAREIRRNAARGLETRRADLLAQLGEADIVTSDFHKFGEERVALILGETVRAVAARRFPDGGFRSSFPDETLAAIRTEITSRK